MRHKRLQFPSAQDDSLINIYSFQRQMRRRKQGYKTLVPRRRLAKDKPVLYDFESEEIKLAVGYIEFTMDEIVVLAKECIEASFDDAFESESHYQQIKQKCIGTNY